MSLPSYAPNGAALLGMVHEFWVPRLPSYILNIEDATI